MTRKDYRMIAEAISETRGHFTSMEADKVLDNLIARLVMELRGDNARFDKARFIAACEHANS